MREAYPPWEKAGRAVTAAASQVHGLVGINRMGNQCYIIAALQLLGHCPLLMRQIRAGQHDTHQGAARAEATAAAGQIWTAQQRRGTVPPVLSADVDRRYRFDNIVRIRHLPNGGAGGGGGGLVFRSPHEQQDVGELLQALLQTPVISSP